MMEPNNYQPQFGGQQPQPQPRPYVSYIPYGYTPETFEERKKVRKIANTTGFVLLVVFGISEIITTILQLVLSYFNLWTGETVDFILDPGFSNIFDSCFSIIVFTIPFIIAFRIGGTRISSLIRFRFPKRKNLLAYLLFGVGFCAFSNITVAYFGDFFSIFGTNYTSQEEVLPSGFFGFMLTFISTAVIPPLVEEFAFRGIVLGSLKKFGNGFAVLTTSILFGVVHGNFQQIPFAFLVGLILGFVTIKCGSIWVAIVIHAFNNATSVILDYLSLVIPRELQNPTYVVFLLISLLIGIFGVALLSKHDDAYTLKNVKTKSEKGKIYRWFFTSPTIIIFLILNFVNSCNILINNIM